MASVRFTDVQARPSEFLDLTSLTLDEFQQSLLLDSGGLGSNAVREVQCLFKAIEKEGLQGVTLSSTLLLECCVLINVVLSQ